MKFEVNQKAVEKYRRASQTRRSFTPEEFLPSSEEAAPSNNKPSPYMNAQKKKSLAEKNPGSVDRSLRVDSWVGGHTPHGEKKPRRSWTPKAA